MKAALVVVVGNVSTPVEPLLTAPATRGVM
jgi:hypothetical protein